jgi:hypothetical protein
MTTTHTPEEWGWRADKDFLIPASQTPTDEMKNAMIRHKIPFCSLLELPAFGKFFCLKCPYNDDYYVCTIPQLLRDHPEIKSNLRIPLSSIKEEPK